ncbi:hypothetical protein ACWA7J_15185 [Leptothrix sp. BB-4]
MSVGIEGAGKGDADEVLRRIGRNVMLYLEIEARLKDLWLASQLAGSLEDIARQPA